MPSKDKKKTNEYDKQYYLDNKERIKKRVKQYQKDNRKRLNEYQKKWSKKNPEKCRRIRIKFTHSLSHEEWQEMWDNQDGKCLICGKKFKNPSDACVDHNHETKTIRGLLCLKCNFGISNFNDNPKLTARATEYLLGDKNVHI